MNAHILPGPNIISSLAESAREAIAAHNTSVQTDISASPPPSVVDGTDDRSRQDHLEADSDSDIGYDRTSRKHSVVSISTTISTKSEAISPEPALRSSLSRQTSEDDGQAEQDRAQQLEELGPPPFYRSLLLLAQMSSKDNYFTPEYTASCVKDARSHRDFVMGFIAQESLNTEEGDNFITMTPGVQLAAGGDGMGQQYNTPKVVVEEAGSDVIIVGRGILGASDRVQAAREYRRQGWEAYESRLQGR